MIKARGGITALGAAALLAAGGNAVSAEESWPKFSGEIGIELQNDFTFDSDDPAAEQNELGTSTGVDLYLHFSENFYINAGLLLEAVRDPGPQEDRVFQDHGLFVEVLTINWENDTFGVYAGKFGPNFSLGYDAAAGLYGTDILGDDVELAEFLGAGGAINLGDSAFGSTVLSASVFTADTTILSESFITNRGRTRQAAGEPGNTESPESFAIALDGEAVPGVEGFRYHVAYAHLGADAAPNEHRIAVAGEWSFEVQEGVTLTPLAEYVRFENAGGNGNESRNYFTASLGLSLQEKWFAALAYTGKDVTVSGGGNGDTYDDQVSLSVGYAFDNGLGLDVGYKHNRSGGIGTSTVGALLTYGFEF
ncbi:MAG: hypothetical protein ACMVY4_01165 [Minwuia sp.]|uniref:hypothetical protein n=1 Tax=Minwuia sp. TaxID=2493630 RepID=UPI003A89856A